MRQAHLARFLAGVDVQSLDDALGRRVGVLLGRSKSTDVVDAAVVLLCRDGDEVFTSDPADLRTLATTAGVQVRLIPV